MFRPSEIAPEILVGVKRENLLSLCGEIQVRADDRESSFLRDPLEKPWRNHMDAGKRQGLRIVCRAYKFSFHVRLRSPAAKLIVFVEEQITRRLPILDRERGERVIFRMVVHHAAKIDGTDDIDIMQNEWFIQTRGI